MLTSTLQLCAPWIEEFAMLEFRTRRPYEYFILQRCCAAALFYNIILIGFIGRPA